MAFAATASTSEPRSFSGGPLKMQLLTYTAASADTSGTITANRLSKLDHVVIDGKIYPTAATTYSGNAATITFADPGGNVFGTILCFGK